jgi:hypothetical protein
MTNEPPAANVAPAAKLPVVRIPVVKLKDPRLPLNDPPLKPFTLITLEPAKVSD